MQKFTNPTPSSPPSLPKKEEEEEKKKEKKKNMCIKTQPMQIFTNRKKACALK